MINRLAVNVGDVLKIEGRLYVVVPAKQGARRSNRRSR
jgi:hypothetical protein